MEKQNFISSKFNFRSHFRQTLGKQMYSSEHTDSKKNKNKNIFISIILKMELKFQEYILLKR